MSDSSLMDARGVVLIPVPALGPGKGRHQGLHYLQGGCPENT